MASDQQFCLRWNNHQSTLVSVFDNLLESQTLVDCTLAADGQYLKAHKVVLSACSPYLEAILCQNLDKHPILILKDVKFSELKAMLDYMYRGEVNISQEQLSTFLKAAESLQIKGLTDSGGGGSSDRDRDRERERDPLKRQDLRKPLNQPVPHIPQPRPVVPHPGLMERRSLPHFPPHIADMQPQSPRHAREGSTSPTARKRRRPNRPSSDDSNFVSTPNSLSENQPDTSDSCDVPVKQASSSTPNVPNATTKAPETDSNRTTPQPPNNQQNSEQKQQVTVKKEFTETLLTPKTEFDYGNDNSMEDVTYEDDEEEEVDLSKPGTSFAANSQGFPPWQMGGDGSNDDSNNMYSPDVTAATNQNNSQDPNNSDCEAEWITPDSLRGRDYIVYYQCSDCPLVFTDEVSQKRHSCHAKRVRLSILEEPTTLVHKKEELSDSSYTPGSSTKPFEIVECTVINPPQDSYVCSNCEVAFEELHVYKQHTCVRRTQKSQVTDKSSPSKLSGSTNINLENNMIPLYKCGICKSWYKNIPEYQKHPCFNGKGVQRVNHEKSTENLQEDESINIDKLELNSSIEDLRSNPEVPEIKVELDDTNGLPDTPPPTRQARKRNQSVTPWRCSVCDKYFRARYYLMHHSCTPPSSNPLPRGSLGKPPYICPKCGVSFKHKTSYCRHIHHHCKENERPEKEIPPPIPKKPRTPKPPGTGPVKPFQCSDCEKSFAVKYYLIHHSCDAPANNPLPHGSLGKPPYRCGGCGVTYKHKSSYCRHIHHECGKGRKFIKVYSGKYVGKSKKKKPAPQSSNVCLLCNDDFQDKDSLQSHVQTDHLSL